MSKVTIDGANTLIVVNGGITAVDVQVDLYSYWKTWVLTSDNAKYFPAFRVIGGDPLGGDTSAGAYFFLQNQYGWRVRPQESNHELTLSGNIFAEDLEQPVFVPTLGAYTVSTRLMTSSLTQAVGTDPSDIADSLLTKPFDTVVSGDPDPAIRTMLDALRFLRNRWEVIDGVLYVYREDDITVAWSSTLDTSAVADRVVGSDPEGP